MAKITWKSLFDFSNSADIQAAITALNRLDKDYQDFINTAKQGAKVLSGNQKELSNSVTGLKKEISGLSEANTKDAQAIQQTNAQAKALNETYLAQKAEIANLTAQVSKLTSERSKVAKAAKDVNNINKEAIRLEAQLGKTTGKTADEVAELKIQLQNATKATKDKARESLGLVSLYEKESKTLVNLRNKYKDVALAQGVGSKAAKKLEKDVVALDSKLKKIDSNVGQHQRSVGNYSKSWNGLNNSINQLSREAPAFAVSMNTGFLAISNNIPTLVDEINKLKVANKGLIAQGKPAKSVFKSLAGAILSWQTLISVGVTLLTLYGGKLIELIKKNLNLKSSFDALNKTQEKANELSSESVSKFKTLISIVNDSTKSELDRKAALEELKKEYPSFISSLEDEGKNLTISAIAAGKIYRVFKTKRCCYGCSFFVARETSRVI